MNNRIEKIKINQYKMFNNFEIDLNGSPIIVLTGANASGKTTVLNYINENYDDAIFNKEILDINVSLLKYIKNGCWGRNKTVNELIVEVNSMLCDIYLILGGTAPRISSGNLYGDFIFKNNGHEFEIKDLSSGETAILSKILYMYLNRFKNKILLVDEPEASLHPSWQNNILKIYETFAKHNNCQIIIATHSAHIISNAKNEYLRVLNVNIDGNTVIIDNVYNEGRDINSVLFDVMGETACRPAKFTKTIDQLFIEIDEGNFNKAKEILNDLSIKYGENDSTVIQASMLIDIDK